VLELRSLDCVTVNLILCIMFLGTSSERFVAFEKFYEEISL
jgi:hypothetical protein